jgi:alpha-1,3-mannosyltransferase
MQIVHVVRQFYPAVGGFESVVRELASAQAAAGHRVRVVTLNRLFNTPARGTLPARETIDGFEVVRVPFVGSQRYPLAPSAIKFIRDADVVHVHAIDFFCDYFAWTKPFHRKKLLVSTHGGFFHTRFAARLKRLYFSVVTRLSLTWYDCVVAVSVSDRELFGQIRNHAIVCVENGVNVRTYRAASPAAPVKRILALGRLAGNKRLDRLLAFLAALRRFDPQWQLTIAGRRWDVPADELKARAQALHIGDAVAIVVDPDESQIRQLMSGCSVLASASEYEGFGVAAVEGMSAGLFPLLSDIPSYRRLVARTGIGMLVDFSDVDAAVSAFRADWSALEANYARRRQAAIEAASGYDWQRVSRTYAELYDHICGATTRTILGVPIVVATASQMLERLDARFERNEPTLVAFANSHALNVASRDCQLRAMLQKSLVLNDGIGVDIASLVLFGKTFPQNLNGTDFMPYYLEHTRHRCRLFLLGGRPGNAERAARRLTRRFPQHQIVGWHHGHFTRDDADKVNAIIRAADTDIVLVGMGNPKQELWLADNLAATGSRLGFAVGGLFDFVTGDARRAPGWVRTIRLEWVYRMMQEPSRLALRYLIGNPLFMLKILGQWFSREDAESMELKSS